MKLSDVAGLAGLLFLSAALSAGVLLHWTLGIGCLFLGVGLTLWAASLVGREFCELEDE